MKTGLKIAISKGRILQDFVPLLQHIGIEPEEDPGSSRKLILKTNHEDIQLIIVRATDVPTYVEHAAADMGIAGKDVLMEAGCKSIYEPLDLNIARCRLMTAGVKGQPEPAGRLKVASKYANIARRYYAEQGKQVEVIKLYGSMELAPILGLADVIVDLVDTGNTLKANGLEPRDLIANISSRLVVNKASMKVKQTRIQGIIDNIQQYLDSVA